MIAYGQQGPGVRRQFDVKAQAKRTSDAMKELLKLICNQMKQVEAIIPEAFESIAKVFESAAGDRQAMRLKIAPINEARDNKLKEILTADHWREYEKMKKEQYDRMRQLRAN